MTTQQQVEVAQKVRVGRVVSDAMDKTVVVAVERRVQHPLYGKAVRHMKKFKAHDEKNEYRAGDLVRIIETRPISKTKRWRVAELLDRQELPDVEPEVAAAVRTDQPAEPEQRRRRGPTRAAQRAAARRAELEAAGSATQTSMQAEMEEPVEKVVEDAEVVEELVEEEETLAEEEAVAEKETAEEEAVAETESDADEESEEKKS
jgi:small subunit ribosomal protein S17